MEYIHVLNWLKSLPKTAFVTLILSVGVLYIVLSDPPKNICDAQIDQFDLINVGLLSPNPKDPSHKTSKYQDLFAVCKDTKSPGGCYELFSNLKVIIKNARTVSPECFGKLSGHKAFSDSIWSSLDLIARLAWGDKAPEYAQQKLNWFDAADTNLFCSLKQTAEDVYGKDRFASFQEEYFKALPGADKLVRDEAWKRMIFSLACESYL
jgi:hypothetical protein